MQVVSRLASWHAHSSVRNKILMVEWSWACAPCVCACGRRAKCHGLFRGECRHLVTVIMQLCDMRTVSACGGLTYVHVTATSTFHNQWGRELQAQQHRHGHEAKALHWRAHAARCQSCGPMDAQP